MIGAKAEYYKCTSCGYEEGSITIDLKSLALGLAVGTGIGGALYLKFR